MNWHDSYTSQVAISKVCIQAAGCNIIAAETMLIGCFNHILAIEEDVIRIAIISIIVYGDIEQGRTTSKPSIHAGINKLTFTCTGAH